MTFPTNLILSICVTTAAYFMRQMTQKLVKIDKDNFEQTGRRSNNKWNKAKMFMYIELAFLIITTPFLIDLLKYSPQVTAERFAKPP